VLNDRICKTKEGELKRNLPNGLKSRFTRTDDAVAFLTELPINGKGSKLHSVSVNQIYHVVDPSESVDTLSHLMCKYTNADKSSPNGDKKVIIYARQFLGSYSFWNENENMFQTIRYTKARNRCYSDFELSLRGDGHACSRLSDTKVNFVMALSRRPNKFVRFLKNFEETFLSRGHYVNLIVSYFSSGVSDDGKDEGQEVLYDADAAGGEKRFVNDRKFVKDRLHRLKLQYPSSRIHLTVISNKTAFSRGLSL